MPKLCILVLTSRDRWKNRGDARPAWPWLLSYSTSADSGCGSLSGHTFQYSPMEGAYTYKWKRSNNIDRVIIRANKKIIEKEEEEEEEKQQQQQEK